MRMIHRNRFPYIEYGLERGMTMDEMITIKVDGEEKTYKKGTTFAEIAVDAQKNYDAPIVLAMADYKLHELHKVCKDHSDVRFETLKSNSGHKAYKRSACLLMIKSIYDVVGREKIERIKVEFSIGKGYYCSYRGDFKMTEELLLKVKERMQELVKEDIPITKQSCPLDDVILRCAEYGMTDKVKLFRYRRGSKINMYSLSGFEDYYYGYMVPSSGYIKWFDLYLYDDGFIIQLPERKKPECVPMFTPMPKLFQTMKESEEWGEMLGVETVAALNDKISEGKFQELMLVQEALQESRISDIAEDIIKRGGKKFVMIAGPSSSGKTTFSHRLSIQLMAHGMKPHPIAVDDYFVDREKTPLDENGKLNFECLGAIDVEQFNRDMTDLLNGRTVEIPSFNFKTGKREYRGNFKTLGPEDILVIEGIHGLNDELSYSLPKESKYKIYISALTTLNVDEHNRIPTTDGRLIRRMVRDFRTRGASAQRTLEMWGSVRRGEEENIFPFQESADAMFNSALIYELAVLKQFAEPLLYSIPKEVPEYQEAKRLLKFLEYFLGVSSEHLPIHSIIREFVGGSCFNV